MITVASARTRTPAPFLLRGSGDVLAQHAAADAGRLLRQGGRAMVERTGASADQETREAAAFVVAEQSHAHADVRCRRTTNHFAGRARDGAYLVAGGAGETFDAAVVQRSILETVGPEVRAHPRPCQCRRRGTNRLQILVRWHAWTRGLAGSGAEIQRSAE